MSDILMVGSDIHNSQIGTPHEDANDTAEIRDNAIQANQVGISIMGGAPHIYGGAGTGKGNVITGNTRYGIYIGAGADLANLNIEWNDIRLNAIGIQAENPGTGDYFDGRCNWWNHQDGPDDDSPELPDQWDNDLGQDVGDYFCYRDVEPTKEKGWLDKSMTDPTTQCIGGI